jgi:hypothetical protein
VGHPLEGGSRKKTPPPGKKEIFFLNLDGLEKAFSSPSTSYPQTEQARYFTCFAPVISFRRFPDSLY